MTTQGRWILVIDDDDSIRELLELILEAHGFAVETAENGADALQRLGTLPPPALILLDLMMPGMDGLAFLKELRSHATLAAVPVVVLSGDSTAGRRLGTLDVQGCMLKPIELDDLVRTASQYAAA